MGNLGNTENITTQVMGNVKTKPRPDHSMDSGRGRFREGQRGTGNPNAVFQTTYTPDVIYA